MPQEYSATDARNGLQVTIRGDFPDDRDERVRIARTANLFTRLMATILGTENATERHERFRAVETQLEVADAVIRGDGAEVQRLLRETLTQMGVSEEQMREVEQQLRQQIEAIGGEIPPELRGMFGGDELDADSGDEPDSPLDERPLDDR